MTPLKLITLLLPALPLASADWPGPGALAGWVAAVADGDTLTVRLAEETVRVRLRGIDCPEKHQPFAADARAFTAGLAMGGPVTVVGDRFDRFGRLVAEVVLADGRNLNHEIVAAGLAWWSPAFAPGDLALEKLETDARDRRRGLWAETGPAPPWEWRREAAGPARADRRRSESRSEAHSRRRDTRRSGR